MAVVGESARAPRRCRRARRRPTSAGGADELRADTLADETTSSWIRGVSSRSSETPWSRRASSTSRSRNGVPSTPTSRRWRGAGAGFLEQPIGLATERARLTALSKRSVTRRRRRRHQRRAALGLGATWAATRLTPGRTDARAAELLTTFPVSSPALSSPRSAPGARFSSPSEPGGHAVEPQQSRLSRARPAGQRGRVPRARRAGRAMRL